MANNLGTNKDTTFALIGENPGGFGFGAYTDMDGMLRGIEIGSDQRTGTKIYRKFKWPSGKRLLHLRNKAEIEHVRNSPFCEGSDFKPAKPYYKVLDRERDAELILTEAKLISKAENLALNMDEVKLKYVSALYSCFDNSELIQRQFVLHHAGAEPEKFIKICEDEHLEVKSLIRTCISDGIIKEEGTILKWEVTGRPSLTLGTSMDKAVAKLVDDERIYEGLKIAISEKRKNKK